MEKTDFNVITGVNAVTDNADKFKELGKMAMIVTGRHSSFENGSADDVKAALEKVGIGYVIFSDIEENPSVETVYAAASAAVKYGVDMFVGVGGGSPMDAAKAISLLAKNGVVQDNAECSADGKIVHVISTDIDSRLKAVYDFLYTPAKLPYYPVACVATTSGTGSEATPYSILTSHIKKTKKSIAHKIMPCLAFDDPTYLKSASYKLMKSSCVDALAHMIESRLNTNANSFSIEYAEKGLKLWAECKGCLESEKSFEKITDEQYATFMEASALAGMAIAYTGTSLPHGLSYAFTYNKGIAHGKAVGVFLPGFVKNYGDSALVMHILRDLLGFESVSAFRNYIRGLFGKLENYDDVWEKGRDGLLLNPAKLKNYPYEINADILDDYIEFYNK